MQVLAQSDRTGWQLSRSALLWHGKTMSRHQQITVLPPRWTIAFQLSSLSCSISDNVRPYATLICLTSMNTVVADP